MNIAIAINCHNSIQTIACSLIRCQYSYILVKRVGVCKKGEIASD
jgi:hypothetical protein